MWDVHQEKIDKYGIFIFGQTSLMPIIILYLLYEGAYKYFLSEVTVIKTTATEAQSGCAVKGINIEGHRVSDIIVNISVCVCQRLSSGSMHLSLTQQNKTEHQNELITPLLNITRVTYTILFKSHLYILYSHFKIQIHQNYHKVTIMLWLKYLNKWKMSVVSVCVEYSEMFFLELLEVSLKHN